MVGRHCELQGAMKKAPFSLSQAQPLHYTLPRPRLKTPSYPPHSVCPPQTTAAAVVCLNRCVIH